MDDDLNTLGPGDLIRAIQGLLLNNTSDVIRALLLTQRVSISNDVIISRDDDTFTYEDLLESPFFVIKNLRPLPLPQVHVQANARTHRLSGNISKTAQAVLKGFYGYNVTFAEWIDFEDSNGRSTHHFA